jgi:hypothetical protein
MRRGLVVALGLLGGLVVGAPLSAASFSLTAEETREAIRVGQRSIVHEEFDREWRVAGAPGESVKVVTSFFRVVQAARNAAFKGEALRPREVDALLRDQRGRLDFWVSLTGGREDFARWYRPVLVVPGRGEIAPSFVQNERSARPQEDGRYLARSLFSFPTRDLDGKARVTLVVRDHEAREVARFAVDLGRMR